nr:plasmid pRiA4b ORF-3 family protein [Bacillus sp. FJAT-18017]
MNDSSRFVVVLYGLKAKDFKKLDELAVQGIREALTSEGIKKEVIDAYLEAMGKVVFSKTKDRKLVARLDRQCMEVEYFSDEVLGNEMFQLALGKRINRLLVGDGKNSYLYPNEVMYRDLEEFSGGPVIGMPAVQLKISLSFVDEQHKVWRRVIVPLNRTFADLHTIIQTAFGWENSHLHEFYLYKSADSDYDHMVSWGRSQGYRKFDINQINRLLKYE